MSLIEQINELKKEVKQLKAEAKMEKERGDNERFGHMCILKEANALREVVELAVQDLLEGGMGLKYDSSWIRPLKLSDKESQEKIRQAILRLQSALAVH